MQPVTRIFRNCVQTGKHFLNYICSILAYYWRVILHLKFQMLRDIADDIRACFQEEDDDEVWNLFRRRFHLKTPRSYLVMMVGDHVWINSFKPEFSQTRLNIHYLTNFQLISLWEDRRLSRRLSLDVLSVGSRRIERVGRCKLIQTNLTEPDVEIFMNLTR